MTATTDTSAELLTPGEAARLLRVSERTVRRLLVAGDLAGFRVGRQWRIATSDLDARLLPSAAAALHDLERKESLTWPTSAAS